MATQVDPVRNTLDQLQLDPRSAEDRPYLITVLRRLGYSEVEIQQILGEAPAPEAPARDYSPVPAGDERIIEIEYTGPGLRDFRFVVPPEEGEFGMELGAGLEAGVEELGGGPSLDEVDAIVAGSDEDAWGDWGDDAGGPESQSGDVDEESDDMYAVDPFGEEGEKPEGEEGEEAEGEEDPFSFSADEMGTPPEDLGEPDVEFAEGDTTDDVFEPFDDVDEADALSADEPTFDIPDEEDNPFQVGEPLVEFEETRFNEGRVRPAGAPKDYVELDDELVFPSTTRGQALEEWGDVQETAPMSIDGTDAFEFEDWTLYSRDVPLATGKTQRIYFFARGTPENGKPSPMPEGYEVAVNDRTGLPFLRRTGEDPTAAPRKRVRVQRVRATSPEEAASKVKREGVDVLSAVPIDIEEDEA